MPVLCDADAAQLELLRLLQKVGMVLLNVGVKTGGSARSLVTPQSGVTKTIYGLRGYSQSERETPAPMVLEYWSYSIRLWP